MNESAWLSRLLYTGAVLEAPVGLALLIVPSMIASLLLGVTLTDSGLVVARLAGGGLLALGIACWFARATPSETAAIGVAGALLTYNIVVCVLLAVARPAPITPILQLAASAIHGLLAVGLLTTLIAHHRRQRAP